MLNLNVLPLRGSVIQFPVKIVLLLPECEVCGKRVDGAFLKKWNDRNTCFKCINEYSRDYPE